MIFVAITIENKQKFIPVDQFDNSMPSLDNQLGTIGQQAIANDDEDHRHKMIMKNNVKN